MPGLLKVRIVGLPDPALRATLPLVQCLLTDDDQEANFAIVCAEDAEKALTVLHAHHDTLTFVFLQKPGSFEQVELLYHQGALGVCSTSNNLEGLRIQLEGWRRLAAKISKMTAQTSELKALVDRDHLTGLLNMRSFCDRLEAEMIRAARYGRALSVVMIDIDNFKLINDQNDHLFGSQVLRQVGQILRDSVRQVDFCARFGGDEFVLGLVETNAAGAELLAERLREALATKKFTENYQFTSLTASFGIAENTLGSGENRVEDLIRRADLALYNAKESGKNRVCVYLPATAIRRKLTDNEQ